MICQNVVNNEKMIMIGQSRITRNVSCVLIGWFGATQAFETIGLIAGIVGLILVVLYIFINQTAGNRTLFIVSLVSVGIAGA